MNSILLFQSHTTGKIAHYYHLQWALSTYDSLLLVSLNINPVLEAVARFSFHSFISNVSIYTLSGQELSTNKNKTHALSMQYHRNNVSRNIITTQYAKQVQSRKLLSACLQCWKKSQQQQQQKSVCLRWMLRLRWMLFTHMRWEQKLWIKSKLAWHNRAAIGRKMKANAHWKQNACANCVWCGMRFTRFRSSFQLSIYFIRNR